MYTAVAWAKTDLQKILDSSLDVICTLDSKGRFVTVNAASKKLWGYDPAELLGKGFISMVIKEDQPGALENFQLIKTDPSKTGCENRVCKKDGSVIHVAWSAFWDGKEELMYCVARLMDQKDKVENLLLEGEEQLRFAQRLAKIGNWHFDPVTKAVKWSEGLYEVYGVEKREGFEPTLEFFFNLIHPDDRSLVYGEFEKIAGHDRSDCVHRLMRPDGRMVYIRHLSHALKNEKGEIIAFAGIAQDITEQREAEIKLAVSEQKFKSLVQNGSDIIVIVDENGVFKYASPTTLKIAGYEPEELVGRNALAFIHPEDVSKVAHKLADVVNSKNDGIAAPHRFLAKNGEWIWLESQGSNMMKEAHVEGIVINARHITERKKLEEQLAVEQKNRQRAITSAVIRAQESERSQLGQELHDNVNQVLTTVKLYNEMLLDGIGDSTDILQKSVHHLQSCINEIRSISKRLSAPTLGKITLEDSIKELVESINLTRRLQISFNIAGFEQKMVPQDFHLTIYRIIQEQLNNIIKYAEAKQVSIYIKDSKEGVWMQIEDDGKGFDPHSKRNGIGITNMETRAENMNGKLEIISAPGCGCKLIARFPCIHLNGRCQPSPETKKLW